MIIVLLGPEHTARQAENVVLARKPLGDRLGFLAGEGMTHIGKERSNTDQPISEVRIGESRPECLGTAAHHLEFLRLPIRELAQTEKCRTLRDVRRTDDEAV